MRWFLLGWLIFNVAAMLLVGVAGKKMSQRSTSLVTGMIHTWLTVWLYYWSGLF